MLLFALNVVAVKFRLLTVSTHLYSVKKYCTLHTVTASARAHPLSPLLLEVGRYTAASKESLHLSMLALVVAQEPLAWHWIPGAANASDGEAVAAARLARILDAYPSALGRRAKEGGRKWGVLQRVRRFGSLGGRACTAIASVSLQGTFLAALQQSLLPFVPAFHATGSRGAP